MAIRPVQRIKHVIDLSGTLTAGANIANVVVLATDTPTLAVTNSVQTGSKVNGIFLNVEVASNETDAGAIPNVYMAVYKNDEGLAGVLNPSGVGSNPAKKHVIHQEMVMLNNLAGGNPRKMFSGVVVIPKGMRRFGADDELIVVLRSTAVNIAFCIQCIYKEFK